MAFLLQQPQQAERERLKDSTVVPCTCISSSLEWRGTYSKLGTYTPFAPLSSKSSSCRSVLSWRLRREVVMPKVMVGELPWSQSEMLGLKL